MTEASFRNIWQNDEVLNDLRENVRIPDACRDCEFYMLCAGDCHGHRLLSGGEISKSVSLKHCTVYKQRIAKALIANVRLAEKGK
ncbi:MAG: SPASM domain-containing protein [Candidatus Sabulitectum sp.]|nr:SPASM domain-containing protein [Candidatus Sabulitectum sp.]